MKDVIYYFTGTGNSLWTAERISGNLGGAELRAVAAVKDKTDRNKYSSIGVVFPVYMNKVPHIVAGFLEKLPETSYLYAAAVNAGDVGMAFSHFNKLIRGSGRELDAGFSIVTPSNYLPFGEAVSGERLGETLSAAEAKINRISSIIKDRHSFFDREATFFHTRIFPGVMYSAGYRYSNFLDKNFSVDDDCNSCGICEEICPVGNVVLEEGKPVWHKSCEMCFACINNCPREAIQYGGKTRGLRRYRNPEVKMEEIINQKRKINE